MRNKKMVYLSGPISGEPCYMDYFLAAESKWKGKGYDVINPARVSAVLPEMEKAEYLKIDIELMSKCGTVAALCGWEKSEGCRDELRMAVALDIPVVDNESGHDLFPELIIRALNTRMCSLEKELRSYKDSEA